MDGPHQRTLRQFHCRDHLWTVFNEQASELGCSVDYLINEAMRVYARGQSSHGHRALAEPEAQSDYPHAAPKGQPTLYLWFDGLCHEVRGEKYVIGRDSGETDLEINHENVSRRHCMISYTNGRYQIKDLGSTNGIEFQQQSIPHKVIEEGDIFYICGFEIRFSYRRDPSWSDEELTPSLS